MISLQNQELLTAAIQHVVQTRTSAVQSSQQAAQQAALKPAAAAAKKPKAAATKTAAKKAAAPKPAAAASGADQGITPYLTASDLVGLNDQQAAAEGTIANAKAGITTAAAEGMKNYNDIGRRGVADVAAANNDAAARGIYQSGIRRGNVGMAQTAALRDQSAEVTKLGLATQNGYNQANGAQQHLTGYLQALTAQAAENGAALPVSPGYQNGAQNVPGAATVKKVARKAMK